MKCYYVIRKDLNMSPAKLAVQASHGTVLLAEGSRYFPELWKSWVKEGEMKAIIVEVSSEEKMNNLYTRFIKEHIQFPPKEGDFIGDANYCNESFVAKIYDNGYTEFDGYTYSGFVLLIDEENTPSFIKRLRLYK